MPVTLEREPRMLGIGPVNWLLSRYLLERHGVCQRMALCAHKIVTVQLHSLFSILNSQVRCKTCVVHEVKQLIRDRAEKSAAIEIAVPRAHAYIPVHAQCY